MNRIRLIVLIFISLLILSCSRNDKKIQNIPTEQKETQSITQNNIANKPKKTETIKVEKSLIIKVEQLEVPIVSTNNVEQPKEVKPKIETGKITPPIKKKIDQKIVKEKDIKALVKKPKLKKPIIKKPQVKQTITLTGKVNLKDRKNNADISSTVVYFSPNEGKYTVEPISGLNISTKNKKFEPNVLVIPVGSEVKFPNLDRILHNVFSVSGKHEFDLGLYSAGTVKSVKFDKPGIVYVHCNVHHSMQADIIVLDTPWYTNVNNDGSFSLENIPNKAGTLHVWHPRSNLKKLSVNNNNQLNTFNIDLDITRKKVPKHLNKLGKSYRPKERY